MRELYLFRHGESHQDNLTPNGVEQVRLAALRWEREGSFGSVAMFHSPARRAKDSAAIIALALGVPSIERVELAIGNYNNRAIHHSFAKVIARRPEDIIVLIGHDETRRVLEAIVLEYFGNTDESPIIPQGGLLGFTKKKGYCQI